MASTSSWRARRRRAWAVATTVHQVIRPIAPTTITVPEAAASVPAGVAYWASIPDRQARRTAGSVLTRRHGTARITPAATTEAITDSVAACHTAMAALGARSGQDAS